MSGLRRLMTNPGVTFSEYPGAAVTIVNPSTPSINDPANTISMKIVYPTSGTNLPVKVCLSGWHDTIASLDTGEANLTRWARLGYFVVGVDVRGNASSSGTWDDAGRTTMDVYDALQYVATNYSSIISANRFSLLGFSGGGGLSLLMACRYPDLFQDVTDFFGISDWGSDPAFGWYQQQPARQAALQSAIGGSPATNPDEYASRYSKSAIATNYTGYLSMFHDTGDASVDVNQSQRVRDMYVAASRRDYFYSETTTGSANRWLHAYPLAANQLHNAEPLWKNNGKTQPIKTILPSGTLKILGMLKTKRFTVYMNDGSYLNSGRSRFGTLVYNTLTNSYQVTNDSANYAVVSIVTDSGLVATGVLAAAETFTFTPTTIVVDGNTPIVWFDAASKKLLTGSDVTAIADKTGGPQYQGYAWTFVTNRPALLSSDINSLPAIEFVASSSEGLVGLRRPDLQALSAFSFIDVNTGTIIDQGVGATFQTQFTTVSGGDNYTAISNSASAYGQDAQATSYLVRSVLYDGSQATNATKLVRRDNKVQQSLTFTGTIPATNESNVSSVFGIGKRSYDAAYFNGKIAEFMIFNFALSDIGDKEDLLKTKYAI
jgi:pimeloyl-ACP methyl ester carboxylesterase